MCFHRFIHNGRQRHPAQVRSDRHRRGIGGGSLVYNCSSRAHGTVLVVTGARPWPPLHGLPAGGFRNLWTTAINQQLCTRSIQRWPVQGDMGWHRLQQNGYLFTHSGGLAADPAVAAIWRPTR